MKRSVLERIIREILAEDGSVTGTGASFAPGSGEQYATLFAFGKKRQKEGAGIMAKDGYKEVKRPKRPSHSDLADYLDESHFNTPHAFVTEAEMENSDAVKHTEEMGYKLVKKTNKASDKKNK
jgi:hypothetical protein